MRIGWFSSENGRTPASLGSMDFVFLPRGRVPGHRGDLQRAAEQPELRMASWPVAFRGDVGPASDAHGHPGAFP